MRYALIDSFPSYAYLHAECTALQEAWVEYDGGAIAFPTNAGELIDWFNAVEFSLSGVPGAF